MNDLVMKMKTSKFAVAILIGAWTILSVFYFNMSNKMSSITQEYIFDNYTRNEDYLINTPGCSIPNYEKKMIFYEWRKLPKKCGPRLIFVSVFNSDTLLIEMNKKKLTESFKNGPFDCCYSFASRSRKAGKEDTEIEFTACKRFYLKDTVKIPFVTENLKLACKSTKWSRLKYEDHYFLLKKKKNFQTPAKSSEPYYNVLIIGMDTMSRARTFRNMPRTVKYLQSNGWIDYKGYQKVGYNTFPNVMAVLTGKKMSTVYKECRHGCYNLLLWKKFQESGYVTAYGEDNLSLPDTFANYKGFPIPPTDHYMRPFFLLGEKTMDNFVCSGKVSSGVHVLNFAADFAKTYKDKKMFGWFWINSFSHNVNNLPLLYDSETHDFFNTLNKEGVLENTIVIFLSDHGIRFGESRFLKESYYEERLPLLFVWVPHKFRENQPSAYLSLIANRHRLTTPNDLYMTLQDILQISNNSVKIENSEACSQCNSLFLEKSPNRTCEDAAIDEKWCACHDLNDPLDIKELQSSINAAVSNVQDHVNSIVTKPCTACAPLRLHKVLRSHTYTSGNFSYYVIAFTMVPEKKLKKFAFEANVRTNGNSFEVIPTTNAIVPMSGGQNCYYKNIEGQFCFCIEKKC